MRIVWKLTWKGISGVKVGRYGPTTTFFETEEEARAWAKDVLGDIERELKEVPGSEVR